MPEIGLGRLFREEHVNAFAIRVDDKGWESLQSTEFRESMKKLESGTLTREANACEKIIEPVLYEVLGFQRSENDSEHGIKFAGAGGHTGNVEYFFHIGESTVPVEAEPWDKVLDLKDNSGRSPVRQGWDYAGLSNSRWFIVTNGKEWRLYKKKLKGSESPLSSCERYQLREIVDDRHVFSCFRATFAREAFLPNRDGVCRLDEFRQKNDRWQETISDKLYQRLVDSRVRLFRAIQPQVGNLSQEEVNDAVVKLLFRVMFILFAEDTPLLPEPFLHQRLIERFDEDRKWGVTRSLYSYIQQYFAWLEGREGNGFGIFPYDGALFDSDPVLDDPGLNIDEKLLRELLSSLSKEAGGRSLNYAQINPRILGNIYEQFLGYVIEIKAGRIHPHADRDTRRKEGSFYTPESVTKFLVEHAVEQALVANPGKKPWELRCLDAACGSGHFLVEFVNHVARLSEQLDDLRSYSQWKRYITEHCTFGVDKDRTAVMLTKLSLWINSAMKDQPFAVVDTHIKCGNSLVSFEAGQFRLTDFEKDHYPEKYRQLKDLRHELRNLESRTQKNQELLGPVEVQEVFASIRHTLQEIESLKLPVAEHFSQELRKQWPCVAQTAPFHWRVEFAEVFEEQGGFDVMVGNPPWGAFLTDIEDYLQGDIFELARGQYDSYELFIELGRTLLHERGAFGFIVPDSITLPEHQELRRMLLQNTTLTRLVRLGEGIFLGVYRGAFLLCFVNQPAKPSHRVRVATLRKADRKVLEKDTLYDPMKTIAEIVAEGGHDVEQGRFSQNPRLEFDILARDEDSPLLETIDANCIDWAILTTKGRGVEIGKSGEVLQCPYCYKWDNVPRRVKGNWQPKECAHCHRAFTIEKAAKIETIISDKPRGDHWKPIIPGDSVNRYYLGCQDC